MDFIIKVGVDGYQFALSQDSAKFNQLQEQIANETKVDIKNQLLLNKKGLKIEDLSTFENDSQLLQTNQFQEQKAFTIYLFDLSDCVEQANYNIPKYEPKMELKQLLITEQGKDTLLNLNANILTYEKQFFQHLLNIKNKYIPYQQKIKAFEKVGQELENQVQSFEVLLKMISYNYQLTKQRKNEILKKYKDSIDKNQMTVKKFDESLENLKKIELHSALQTQQQKYLSDIYYKPESMYKWKNNCLNTSQTVRSKIEKTSQYIKKLKIRIKEERNTTISTCINAYKMHQNQFQQFIQESKQLIQSVVQSTIDEYNVLKQHMINFSQDVNDEPALFYLSQFELGQDQLKQFENAVNHLGEHLEKVNKSIDVFNKLKQTNFSQIQNVFKVMRGFNKEFEQVNEKLKSSDDEVDKMEKDFSYLLNPVLLPQAYQQALFETSRRREFRDIFDEKIQYLMSIIEAEKEKRKKFLQQFGRILPQDFFGQLKNLTPSIQVVNAFVDAELLNITGLHTDKYNSKVDSDSQVESLKQQIEDLNQQCKQTHSYYQDKTPKKQGAYVELLNLTAKNALRMFIQRSENRPLVQLDQNSEIKQKENDSKISNIQIEYIESLNQCKQDLDKYRQRITKLEQELYQKSSDFDQKQGALVEMQQKFEQFEQAGRQKDLQLNKQKEELNKYVNKCESLELQLIQKNSEIQKSQQNNNKEKAAFLEQINQSKTQYQEVLKKLQQLQLANDQSLNENKELEIANQTYLQQVQEYCRNISAIQSENEKLSKRIKAIELERDNKQLELEKQISSYGQLLEGFAEKSQQLEQVGSSAQNLEDNESEYKDQIKMLKNQLENIELALAQKNNEIQLFRDREHQLKLEQQQSTDELTLEFQVEWQRNQELTKEIERLQGQVLGMNSKNSIENILEFEQNKLMLTDPKFIFDLSQIKVGQSSIFIPAQCGVYVPLILKGIPSSFINNEEIQQQQLSMKNYKVKFDQMSSICKEFILDTGLIFIALVTEIDDNEEMVSVTQPSYLIGLEEQDNQIKNFIL